jgi:photosystem II stability/assembly factor-like uncharacterized protein
MKKCISVAVILIMPILLHAQWKQNESFTGGGIINDIISYKNNIFIAIADNGLYSSSDNGDSWSKVNIDHNWSIDRFVIHQDLLIAATSGFIFKTADGINWDKYEQPGSFVKEIQSDGENLYMANLIDGIFKSEDDGISWISVNDENTSNGIESFHKANNALYAGKYDDSGILYKSSDDGQIWEQIFIGENKPIFEIGSNSNGIYLNISGKILFSSDEGTSWTTIYSTASNSKFMKIQEDVIYLNVAGRIYSSIDNGGNWLSSDFDLNGFSFSSLYINSDNIFVGMWGGGVARNSISADVEWSLKNIGLFLDNVKDIEFINDVIYVGTGFSFVKSTTDNGKSWHQESDPYNLKGGDARKMSVFNGQVYVGGGGSGISTKNKDGNWEQVSEELPGQIIDGLCANQDYLFAAVSDYGVYRSDDPADSWIKKSDGLPSGIRDLYTFGEYLFVGTYNGIYLSSDNGESWIDISRDIPDKSINSIVLLDSTIIATCQYGGAFRTKISDNSWEKISGESIGYLKLKNHTIFKSSSPGSLALSYDKGDTWELINNDLPSEAYITALGFSKDYIYAGFGRPGQGIWQRDIHELIPAEVSDNNMENEDQVIRENEPITISYDQKLMDNQGNPIDSTSLQTYIKVYNSSKEEVGFTASIDTTSKIIEVSVVVPADGESYIVQLDSMANKSNLKTAVFNSQPYTFAKNNPPVLSPILINTFENNEIIIPKNEILASFEDEENDPLSIIHITQIPNNGILTMGGDAIENNVFIDANDLVDFVYTPRQDFIGKDTIKWNAFDGFDYSDQIANITLSIDAITGLNKEKANNMLTVFPCPSSDMVNLQIRNDEVGEYHFTMFDVNGRLMKQKTLIKLHALLNHVLNINDIPNGIYFLDCQGPNLSKTVKIIRQ